MTFLRGLAVAGLLTLAACAKAPAPEPAPAPAPEPEVAAAPTARATVCAPSGYLTENIVARFGDLFSATDSVSVRRRRGLKVARVPAPAPKPAVVADEAVCARAVRAIAPVEPAAFDALGRAPKAAKGKPAPVRPVKARAGGVFAVVQVGQYYLVQDATARPNDARSAPTYVLDGAMRVRGVFN